MKITFAPEAAQDWDGIARVFNTGLIGATVEVVYKDGWAPLAYPDDEGEYRGLTVADLHPASADIEEVGEDGLWLAYDDGSVRLHAPFHIIEEVKYL